MPEVHGCYHCGNREQQPLISRSTPKGSVALCKTCDERLDKEGPEALGLAKAKTGGAA